MLVCGRAHVHVLLGASGCVWMHAPALMAVGSCRDKEIFVDFMMIEELGILPDEENASAWKNGTRWAEQSFVYSFVCSFVGMWAMMVACAYVSSRWCHC